MKIITFFYLFYTFCYISIYITVLAVCGFDRQSKPYSKKKKMVSKKVSNSSKALDNIITICYNNYV